jgi:ABC-2 type transport system ATP-binding protein
VNAYLVIEVTDLRRSYGPVRAVDGVDRGVRRGEVMALLGPNGAGKPTTVEILEGYRRRDSGTVGCSARTLSEPAGHGGPGGPSCCRRTAIWTTSP